VLFVVLTLALFVARILADDAYGILAPYDPAVATEFLY
jgi:hypothetical protein